jgi:hypothetical protein
MPDLAYLSLLKRLVVPEPDYIVYIEGEVVKAKNTRTLEVEYQSADAGEVLNYVISKIDGGVIYIKRGVYNVDTEIVIDSKNSIMLIGEIPQYGLIPAPGATRLQPTRSLEYVIKVTNSKNVAIANVDVYGAQEYDITGNGVLIDSSESIVITHSFISDFMGTGILLRKCKGVIIDSSVIGGATDRHAYTLGVDWFGNDIGIHVDGSSHVEITNSYIIANWIYGVYITSESDHAREIAIRGCSIMWHKDNPGTGVYIYRATANYIEDIVIAGNRIYHNYDDGVRFENTYTLYGYGGGRLTVVGNSFDSNCMAGGYGQVAVRATGDPIWMVVIVGNTIADTLGAIRRPVYAEKVKHLVVAGNVLNREPYIVNSEQVLVTDATRVDYGAVWSAVPYVTELPNYGYFIDGSLVVYYDGTTYKICAKTPAGWKCTALS